MLPPNLKTMLKASAHTAHQKHINRVRAAIGHANATQRAVAIKASDEPGAAEARAVDKVLLLP